jgi:hypothetical protein
MGAHNLAKTSHLRTEVIFCKVLDLYGSGRGVAPRIKKNCRATSSQKWVKNYHRKARFLRTEFSFQFAAQASLGRARRRRSPQYQKVGLLIPIRSPSNQKNGLHSYKYESREPKLGQGLCYELLVNKIHQTEVSALCSASSNGDASQAIAPTRSYSADAASMSKHSTPRLASTLRHIRVLTVEYQAAHALAHVAPVNLHVHQYSDHSVLLPRLTMDTTAASPSVVLTAITCSLASIVKAHPIGSIQ